MGDGGSNQHPSWVSAQEEEAKATPEEKADLLYHKRRLQAVETACRMYQAWRHRSSLDCGVRAFMQQWTALKSFCAQEPTVEFECMFLSRVHLDVICQSSEIFDTATSLKREALGIFPEAEHTAMQHRYLGVIITSVLSNADYTYERARSLIRSFVHIRGNGTCM